MAKGRYLTPHQRCIVRRYYEHQDDLAHQRLSEIVSELYLCEDERMAEQLWQSARTALLKTQAACAQVESIVARRDVGALAALIGRLF